MVRDSRQRVARRRVRQPEGALSLISITHMVLDDLSLHQQTLHRVGEIIVEAMRTKSPRVCFERFAHVEAYIDLTEQSLIHLRRSVKNLRHLAMR